MLIWNISCRQFLLNIMILLLLSLHINLFTSTSVLSQTQFENKERRLGTNGESKRIYHHIAAYPYSISINHDGFIVGVEKARRNNIGIAHIKELDTSRFILPPGEESELRRRHMDKVTDDTKVMFVSHVLAYEPDTPYDPTTTSHARFSPRFIHNAYPERGVKTQSVCSLVHETASHYEKGWQALELLECEIRKKLHTAKQRSMPYTHFLIMSMGWNNDQIDSLYRYNRIVSDLINIAKDTGNINKFNPLVVGLTWPSVWGGQSFFRRTLHVASYPNKADDSDEIGYTIANKIVNDIILGIKLGFRRTSYDLT